MAKSKNFKKDGVSKITIYKLNKDFSVNEALFNYSEPKKGEFQNWNYRIFVRSRQNCPPAWRPLVENLLSDDEIPKNSYASLVILFEKNGNRYALTAGYGYADVREFAIRDFGIDIACKTIDPQQLQRLYQKVPTGNVYGLRRTLRGKYMPTNDRINRRSVLKALKGKVINLTLGITIEGRTSLAISGKKVFPEVVDFLDKILKIEKSDKFTVRIKGLDEAIGFLKEELEKELLNRINNNQFDDVLFGYDDDLIFENCEKLKVGRDPTFYSIDNIQDVLDTAKRQKSNNPAMVTVIGYDEQNMKIFKKKLIDLIEGELDYKENKYFRIDKKWYKTNAEYIMEIEKDFKAIGTIESSYFKLWKRTNGKFIDERRFLRENVDQNKILAHNRKISQVEFADIIDSANNYLVHVKKGRGAYLRCLFAQGYVSASMLNGDSEFRKTVMEKFGIDTSKNFTVVYAIFPEGETKINSIFTLFAKVDLLERQDALKDLGFDVRYCIIK